MKRLISNLYSLKGGEAVERTNEIKRLLGLGTGSAGFSFTEAATTHINMTGNATTCIKTETGTFTTGINLGGTLTTGITIGACTTALAITGTTTTAVSISGVSTTALSISGANARGILISGANTIACIDITNTAARAIRIGTKESAATSIAISSGESVDAEPANNYLFGLFAKVASDESDITDELRGAWIRTRVNDGCDIGVGSVGYGYGVCGAEIQLKIYADSVATSIASWQNSAVWAQLETQGAAGVHFEGGSVSQCVLANVGLTSTTIIETGAVVAGVTVNSNTAGSGVTATGGFYGIYICQDNATCLDFTDGIHIDNGSCTTGINIAGGAGCIPLQAGTKANTSGSGVVLTGSGDNSGGVQLYFDDGGASVAGEVVTPIRARMLVTVHQTSGTSVCGSFSQLVSLGTTGTTKNLTTGALRAAYIFNQVGALTMTSSAEVQGINQATTVAGNTTVDTTSKFVGIDINIAGAGSVTPAGNGVVSGLYIRSSGTPQWATGILLANAAAPTGISVGSCTTVLNVSSAATQIINVVDAANVTNFAIFNAIAGCVQGNDVNPNDTPSEGGLGADGCIRILIDGNDYFIPIFDGVI